MILLIWTEGKVVMFGMKVGIPLEKVQVVVFESEIWSR